MRFNEAPIHESGKCDASMGVPLNASSFNEAPIHESGKCVAHVYIVAYRGRLQ